MESGGYLGREVAPEAGQGSGTAVAARFPRQSSDSRSLLGTSAGWVKGWECCPEGLLI